MACQLTVQSTQVYSSIFKKIYGSILLHLMVHRMHQMYVKFQYFNSYDTATVKLGLT